MTMTNLPDLLHATHLALDAATTERLLRLGATNVVRASDCLLIGPIRRDAQEHLRARHVWWDSEEPWDRLYSPDVHWQPPVVVWGSASIAERVNLWRICSWLRHLGIARQDVFILEFDALPPRKAPEEPLPVFDCTSSVVHHPDEALLDHLTKARPFSRERYDRAVQLWEEYTDEDPSRFVQSCLHGVKGFPELAPLWAFLSCLFPRKTPEGDLRPSRLDELILTILSGEWLTPVKVFVHKSQEGIELRQLLSCTGDLFLPFRLDQWLVHGSNPAVERASSGKQPENPMQSSVYRITERGIHLREAGLEELTDAPLLPVAGTEAYAAPWVVLEDGRLVRP